MSDGEGIAVVLAWVHEHLGRELTVSVGPLLLDGLLARGKEPRFRLDERDQREGYDLTFYMPVAHLLLGIDTEAKVNDAGDLVINTSEGRLILVHQGDDLEPVPSPHELADE